MVAVEKGSTVTDSGESSGSGQAVGPCTSSVTTSRMLPMLLTVSSNLASWPALGLMVTEFTSEVRKTSW